MQTALVLCRLLHFASTMLLFGAGAFLWAIVPAELARDLTGSARRIAGGAIILANVTVFAWLALEAGQMGDGWSDGIDISVVSAVAFETDFGRVWLCRIGLSLLLASALVLGRQDRWAFVVPVSAVLLASMGLVGHATMQAGLPGALHRLNHCLHLLSASAWIGALPPLILCLRRFGDPSLRSEAAVALRRFSGIGHFLVAVVVFTGIANTVWTLGAWPRDFTSLYQLLLAAKIALVAAMIAIALVNRYVLTPRIKGDSGFALRAITINSIAELGLGAAVLALVSVFGTLAPV
jgi:copper resistance protein D